MAGITYVAPGVTTEQAGIRRPQSDPNRGSGLYRFAGPSDFEKREQERYERDVAAWKAKNTGGSGGGATTSGTPSDVSGAFQSALDSLSGANSDVEKMYQQGKRRAMSDLAINSVNAGMGNTLNLGAAGMAYDEQNRAATNLGVAQAKAGIYQNLGQTAANVYGTNVGAQTSRYATDVGASTSLATAGMGIAANNQANQLQFQTANANRALQKYIADLSSFTTLQSNNAVPSGMSVPRM